MYNGPVIDADGHVLEKEKYIRKYLEKPWDKRSTCAAHARSTLGRQFVR